MQKGNSMDNLPTNQCLKNDFELAKLAGAGDMAAFEELYNRHHRRVYSLCIRMMQNMSDAEDLTQEVFIQLHRKIDKFRGESAFTTWLHRLAVNQVLMRFRKQKRMREDTTQEGVLPEQIVRGSEKPHKMRVDDAILIEKALSQLPKGYYNVFTLHDMEGYEHEEVAKILGVSIGTSKSQLHKARLKLRKLILKMANPRITERGILVG